MLVEVMLSERKLVGWTRELRNLNLAKAYACLTGATFEYLNAVIVTVCVKAIEPVACIHTSQAHREDHIEGKTSDRAHFWRERNQKLLDCSAMPVRFWSSWCEQTLRVHDSRHRTTCKRSKMTGGVVFRRSTFWYTSLASSVLGERIAIA